MADLEQTKRLFDDQSAEYERLTGGCTRRIAAIGIKSLPPLTSSTHILDLACGPGIVTKVILDTAAEQGVVPPPRITSVDIAGPMIEQLEISKQVHGWTAVETKILNAQKLEGLADESFDAVFMNFGLFAVPDAGEGAKEMLRVLKPGGAAIVTTWKEAPTIQLLEEATASIRPDCVSRVQPVAKEWMTKEKLRDTLLSGGFLDGKIIISTPETSWENKSVDEFVDAMCSPFWARVRDGWSEDENGRWRGELGKRVIVNESGRAVFPMTAWMAVATK
ncbi:S-adenosyl-L-methionine-dependent methyltransferase [Trematosphaeria pertusa]|uniref:S-adenosyl-L-methionine-dependent methyltransferase n=1 Tax=Trematosphaeria pertusa TaxID=390896 RepID=A0A6A6HZA6_9PLEO|nr:S-adenosyl-L-methionine-dependent methyltransferase [Trematosphaeria pertusa]KAF2243367.1 S-adenosyl-L-methionine-dependent methyltransferase [Trematosphaeria pertusa]